MRTSPFLKPASLLLLVMMFFSSCRSNNFQLEIALPPDTDTTVKLMFYASDKKGGRTIESVVPVTAGKGAVTLPAINPAVIYVMSGSDRPLYAFYAERGDKIEISSDSPDPLAWRVKGNVISERLSDWRLANLGALRSSDPKKINAAVAKYVKENPDDEASMILLLTAYDRRADEKGFASLWKSLGEKAKDMAIFETIGRADMTSAQIPNLSSSLPEIILRTTDSRGYADTLRAAPAGASIIFFWHNSMQDRKEEIQHLRRIASDFPDSTRRMIADICLDYDSVTWRMPLPLDSLRHTLRGWLPRGEADPQMIDLGVNRTPWWIVADGKGRIIYRGDDPVEAESKFRRVASR